MGDIGDMARAEQLKWFDELPSERTYQSRWNPKVITHEEFASAFDAGGAAGLRLFADIHREHHAKENP